MESYVLSANLTRKPEETSDEYKNRILRNKDVYGITWDDVAEAINSELGLDYSPDKYRKESYRLEKIEVDEELDDKLLKLRKEKVKLSDERVQVNALARNLARAEVFKEMAVEAVAEISKEKMLELPKKFEHTSEESAIGLLCIGDWHYGLEVDNFYNKYNPEIARQRVMRLLISVLEIIDKQKLREVYLVNLGDMVSGRIHLPLRINTRLDTVSQTMQVSELIAEFITELSKKVTVKYFSVEDNHSRIEPNKKDSIKTEAFSRIIDWYLKERLKDNENVIFYENKLGDDIASFRIFNHQIVAVHGDKDPQRGIVDKLNSYLQTHVDLIISAHMHHFSADENNFTEFYCNGSLIGQDQYAADLRLLSKPSQLFFICTPDDMSSVMYKIKL